MKSLKKVKSFLNNEINFINCGGCGVSTLAMYRWLKNNGKLKGDEKFVFMYYAYNKSTFINNSEVLKNGTGKPIACSHICLFSGGEFFDSDCKIKIDNYKWVHVLEDEKFLIDTINNKSTWNDYFDRDQIDTIAEKLNIDLSDLIK